MMGSGATTATIEAQWPAPSGVQAFTTLRPLDQYSDLSALCGADIAVTELKQVHGITVATAADYRAGMEADACVSAIPAMACRVLTADCLPLLICNDTATEVAAVHAGWRGLCQGVIEATLAKMDSTPASLLVWLGPAISQPNFEVGMEVRQQFIDATPAELLAATEACFITGAPGKYYADLYQLARLRLQRLGVA